MVGFKFTVKDKLKPKTLDSKRDPNTPDFFVKMTDAQRHLFANKMSEMPEMSGYSQGYGKLSAICYPYQLTCFYSLKNLENFTLF